MGKARDDPKAKNNVGKRDGAVICGQAKQSNAFRLFQGLGGVALGKQRECSEADCRVMFGGVALSRISKNFHYI